MLDPDLALSLDAAESAKEPVGRAYRGAVKQSLVQATHDGADGPAQARELRAGTGIALIVGRARLSPYRRACLWFSAGNNATVFFSFVCTDQIWQVIRQSLSSSFSNWLDRP
jgi:hypothetical protein